VKIIDNDDGLLTPAAAVSAVVDGAKAGDGGGGGCVGALMQRFPPRAADDQPQPQVQPHHSWSAAQAGSRDAWGAASGR
jgi:hypothetical protein